MGPRMRLFEQQILKRLGALLTVGVCAWVQVAQAQSGADVLRQIQEAARQLNYVGVYTYQQGDHIESSRITHQFDGKHEKERIEVLDGAPREYLRTDDEVQCLLPEQKTVLRERQRGDRFPGLLRIDPKSIENNYSVSVGAVALRVAGRHCRPVEVMPRDSHRYGYRLCADTESSLLLKAQMIDERGTVIEQIAFTQVTIDAEISDAMLVPAWPTKDWHTVRTQHQKIDLAALGWRVNAPPGYVSTSEVTREFADRKHVHQLVLSDGLATISIFIEPYLPERSEYVPQGAAQSGSVNIYGVRIANYWLTVLGEVPASTLEQLAQSIQYMSVASPR
jgi:sigma-E factor negative regulatory protein RseB